jgi:hypothetical protein
MQNFPFIFFVSFFKAPKKKGKNSKNALRRRRTMKIQGLTGTVTIEQRKEDGTSFLCTNACATKNEDGTFVLSFHAPCTVQEGSHLLFLFVRFHAFFSEQLIVTKAMEVDGETILFAEPALKQEHKCRFGNEPFSSHYLDYRTPGSTIDRSESKKWRGKMREPQTHVL